MTYATLRFPPVQLEMKNEALPVTDEIVIRPLMPDDSLEELTDLLHRGYRQLADMGLRYLATYQSVDVTRERVEKGRCFVAVKDEKLVGTICYYPPGVTSGSPWLDRSEVALFGQFAVEPDLQKQGIGRRLIESAEEIARNSGVAELALDTAEPARHLIEWYQRLGFRFIEHVSWDITNYRSVVMSKSLKPDQ